MIEVGRLTPEIAYRLWRVSPVSLNDALMASIRARFPNARQVVTWNDPATGAIIIEVDDATGGSLGPPELLLGDHSEK